MSATTSNRLVHCESLVIGASRSLGPSRLAVGPSSRSHHRSTISVSNHPIGPCAVAVGSPEPVGRGEPDERQDGDHHQVVLPRRAFVGPEERAPENASGQRGGVASCDRLSGSRSSR